MRNHSYLKNGESLALDSEACVGCGQCVAVCPHAVFALESPRAVIRDRGACMACGACAKNCPAAAIKVESGVGCAAAIILGALRGQKPSCGCGGGGACCG